MFLKSGLLCKWENIIKNLLQGQYKSIHKYLYSLTIIFIIKFYCCINYMHLYSFLRKSLLKRAGRSWPLLDCIDLL